MAMITGTWAERCAADAKARDWAMEYGRGEFYYSQKWGALTAIADGTTTLTDIADAIAAGTATPYQEALAAHYFAQAADYLVGVEESRLREAERGHPVPELEDDYGQVPELVDDSELAVAEMRREFAEAARTEAHQVAREAVDREDDARRWAESQSEEEYHAAGAKAALEADLAGPWRTAVDVAYDQICAEYGNDGPPETDRHISAEDRAAQGQAIEAIAERLGLPTGPVNQAVQEVAERYGRDHTDTQTLGQPDWDQVADDWAALMAQTRADQSGSELPPWERDADQRAYWDELGESHPAVRDAFWDRRDNAMLTADVDITRAELDAAYNAAGDAIVDAAGLPAPALDEEAHRAGWAEEHRAAALGARAPAIDAAQQRVIDAAASVETAEYWLARGEVDPGAGLSEEMPPEWTPESGPQWPVEPRWTSEAGQARLEAKWAADDAAYVAEMVRIAALPAGEREDHAVESTAGFLDDPAADALINLGDVPVPLTLTPAAEQVLDRGDLAQRQPDDEGLRLYAQMLLEEARAEVEAGIDVGQVTDVDALLAEMVDAIAGSPPADFRLEASSIDEATGRTAAQLRGEPVSASIADEVGQLRDQDYGAEVQRVADEVGQLSDQDYGAEVQRVADYLTGRPYYVENILHGSGDGVYEHAESLVALGYTATNLAELDAQAGASAADADHLAEALEDVMGRMDAGLVADPDGEADQADAAVAAYRAAVEASRANWYARAAQLGVTTFSPTPPAELDTWAARNPGGEWAANEDVVARFESDAARDAEAGDGAAALEAHQQRLAQAAAEGHTGRADPQVWGGVADAALAATNRSEWYPQEYSAADDPYDHAFHHGSGEDLPRVPAEYTEHPDAHRSGPTTAAAEELAGALHAELTDALDQARAQLAAGDVAEVDRPAHDARIEQLEAELAADEASAVESSFSADPVLAAHVAGLLSDLDGTSDTYPGDNSAYWDTYNAQVAAELQSRPGDVDAAFEAVIASDEAVPDELVARGGDPTLAAKTAAWMATEAAATEQWLTDNAPGFTPVDSHDHMVERRDRDQQYVVHPATNPWNTPAKRDDVGVATSAAEQEEITRDGERDHYDSYGTGDPDPHPGKAVQQPPDEEPPGKARAADAVAAAHQTVVDTQRWNAQRAEQRLAARWLAADDHAETVGDEVELATRDEALPPA